MKIHRHLVEQVVRALDEIFREQRYADKIIERVLKAERRWGARDRRFFAEGVYECVRWHRRLAYLADVQPPMDISYWMRVWATWAYEQGWLEQPDEWGLQPERLAKRLIDLEMRGTRADRESIPDWLDERGSTEWGDRWPAILTALNQKAPVDLRVNTLKTTREELRARLQTEGIATEFVPRVATALTLPERKNVFTSPAFREGWFEVQDRASQLVAALLDPQPGERVADACAGAGGKSLHIAALMQNKGRLVSLDIHEWKLQELRQRARRAGAHIIEARVIESTKTIKRMAEGFDRVLLDVPCSGLGVLRRNPDTKWKLKPEDLVEVQNLQDEILRSHSRLVKPGGILVYATCSFLPSENRQRVDRFLDSGWSLLEQVEIVPDQRRGDGFYAAKIQRIG